jgi:hypothetical protein
MGKTWQENIGLLPQDKKDGKPHEFSLLFFEVACNPVLR